MERMFHRSPRWNDDEISDLLLADDKGRDLVIRGMSLVLYPNDAGDLELINLSAPAVRALRRHEPRTVAERIDYVRACTAAGQAFCLDQALAVAHDPAAADLAELVTHLRYGAETVHSLGEVLTCIGYLGKMSYQEDADDRSEEAHDFLRSFVTTDHDRTVERGRLLGLAILGDWSPLLSNLRSGDRPMHRGARNAIGLWRSGPFTPGWGRDDESVAERIGRWLARTDLDLEPDVRSTLGEIKMLVERRLGRIILPV
jgi:hypothetical protein